MFHSTFVTTKGSRKGTSVKLSWEASVPELAEGSMRHFLNKVVAHHFLFCFLVSQKDINVVESPKRIFFYPLAKAEFAEEGTFFANRFPSLRTFVNKKVENQKN